MKTLAQRRRDFVLAKRARPEEPPSAGHATAYELMLAKLASDRRRLKQLQSLTRKNEVKKELLPDYDAWVLGALEGNRGGQDDVLVTVMVWRFDTGDFTGGLQIAEYVFRHGLSLPDNYKRTPGTLIADEIADAALAAFAAGHGFALDVLVTTEALVHEADMPDEVRARLVKAIGLALEADGQLEAALAAFERALVLHDRVGVKKDIERVKRTIKNSGVP